MTPCLRRLLCQIHQSIESVARDLDDDRPELARALRQEAAAIPAPDSPMRLANRPPALPPLLYAALDAGLVDARRFDRLRLMEGVSRRRR